MTPSASPSTRPASTPADASGSAPKARKTGMATHYLRYSAGSLLVMVAGLVSFPILTRLLDNTQYGILGYYDTWVLMAVSLGKLGAQHAILRFYPHGDDKTRMHAFSTNLFFLPLALSMTLWAAIGTGLVVFNWLGGEPHTPMFWLALLLMPMVICASMVEMVLRASENSRLQMFTRVGWRWLELLLMLSAVLFLQHSALAAYGGKFAAAVLAMAFYIGWIKRHLTFSRAAVDTAMLRRGMVYGLPLVANELIMVALVSLDRLMIKDIMGDFASVGIYTIGASLAMQVNVFLSVTMFEAFAPMANRLYDTEGAGAVRALKVSILQLMTYASVGIAALLWTFGTDLLVALSGPGKAASGPVFSYMGIVYALQPLGLIAGYGLLLEKRSGTVLGLMCGTLVINATGNLVWIPAYGVMGAVYATALSSLVLTIAHCVLVPRSLLQLPAARTVGTAITAALACAAVAWGVGSLGLGAGWPRLLIGGCATGGSYLLLVLTLDPGLRTSIRRWQALRSAARVPLPE